MTNKEIFDSFLSTKCACGNPKKPKFSHCRSCYYKLPQAMKNNLYKRFFDGYEESFIASLKFLGLDDAVKNEGIRAMFD